MKYSDILMGLEGRSLSLHYFTLSCRLVLAIVFVFLVIHLWHVRNFSVVLMWVCLLYKIGSQSECIVIISLCSANLIEF